ENSADAETSSSAEFTLKPSAKTDIQAYARVEGQNQADVTLTAPVGSVNITAVLPEDSDFHVASDAAGKQTGSAGSVESSSENNVTAKAIVNFTGTESLFKAINVNITASSPLEAQTEYSVSASSDPDTKTETSGTYYSENHITLSGTIIYGSYSSVTDTITVGTDGNISAGSNVSWHKDDADNTVYIDSYDVNLNGGLNITGQNGTVDGEVNIIPQISLKYVNITNRSGYTLNIADFDVNFQNDGSIKNYQLICSDCSGFSPHFDSADESGPQVYIVSERETDLYFSGEFDASTSYVIIEWINEPANMYITANGSMGSGSLYIVNVNNIGSSSAPAEIQMFTSEKTADDGTVYTQYPTMEIAASGDVNLAVTLNKYIETTAADKLKVIDDNKDADSLKIQYAYSDNGNLNLIFNPVNLVLGLAKADCSGVTEEVYGINGTYSVEGISAAGDISISSAGRAEVKDVSGQVTAEATRTTLEIAGAVSSIKNDAVYTVNVNNGDLVFAESDGRFQTWIGSEGATVNITADSISSLNGFGTEAAPAFGEIRGKNITIVSGGGVGDKDNFVSVDVDDDGGLTLDAEESVYVTSGVNLTAAGITSAKGSVNLHAEGNLTASDVTAGNGDVTLSAGGNLTASDITAGNGDV
ncbi:MAG: hypothetical protein HUJ75_02980, partial [Parasporobacterium sp.]|nr:hypothetical protein [Parasporobacterium sp.]